MPNKVIKIKIIQSIKWFVISLLASMIIVLILPHSLHCILKWGFGIDSNSLTEYASLGDSFGVFNTVFSALALGAVVITLLAQIKANNKISVVDIFYKMLDFQQKVVEELSVFPVTIKETQEELKPVVGRKAFVEYKIQIKYLMKIVCKINSEHGLNLKESDVADISYAVFYYGSAPTWKPMMMEYLKDYKNHELIVDSIIAKVNIEKNKRFILNRPNQNFMSVYFRNMYNAIKLIDGSDALNSQEKKDYIKILRAQLSNAELYVLFFNLMSRFGKKWIENGYVEKYQLLQNIPNKYCDGYNPKDYFPTINFEGDQESLSPFH